MSHPEQRAFVEKVRESFPQFFSGVSVLDVGSCDINGNNRSFFSRAEILGVDVSQGPNVDLVCPLHLAQLEGPFDVVISTEALEHDFYWQSTLRKMAQVLRPGGLMIFTCAAPGRAEHGTRRASPRDSLTSSLDPPWADHYQNLAECDISSAIPISRLFSSFSFQENKQTHDLYFWGIRAE